MDSGPRKGNASRLMTAPLSDKRRTGRIDAHVLEAIYLEHLGKLVRESSMDAVVLLAHERVHDPDPFERDWQFKPALGFPDDLATRATGLLRWQNQRLSS
ncbi:MAG TPA: hypothetical protein VF345_05685 [Chthoniobacterales bacterium]